MSALRTVHSEADSALKVLTLRALQLDQDFQVHPLRGFVSVLSPTVALTLLPSNTREHTLS